MRSGKKRKEIYLSIQEQDLIRQAQTICGLDATNTMRMLINLGYIVLSGAPYTVANNTTNFVKPEFKRQLTGH
jgi:hypothetical protein